MKTKAGLRVLLSVICNMLNNDVVDVILKGKDQKEIVLIFKEDGVLSLSYHIL